MDRTKYLGSSDARRICDGDWHNLFLEKTGRKEPEDLTWNFPVQLGTVTEALNLRWYEHVTQRRLDLVQQTIAHEDHPWLRATLDAFDVEAATIVECKHVNQFSKMPELVERYTPQLTHQMLCMNTDNAVLSVIIGTSEPVIKPVTLDEFFAAQYLDMAKAFWGYVELDRAPDKGKPLAVPPPVETFRTVDMSQSNEWGSFADQWLTHKEANRKFDESAKGLKKLVESDVGFAYGAGVEIRRQKNGLFIKESKP